MNVNNFGQYNNVNAQKQLNAAAKSDKNESVVDANAAGSTNIPEGETLRGKVVVVTADGKKTEQGNKNNEFDYTIVLNKDGSVKEVKKERQKPLCKRL